MAASADCQPEGGSQIRRDRCRSQKRAAATKAVVPSSASGGSDGKQVDARSAREGEEARGLAIGADEVVVGQCVAVVAGRGQIDVAHGVAGALRRGGQRPLRRHGPGKRDEPRTLEHPADEPRIGLAHRDQRIDLLVLDEAVAGGADALHDEIEQRRVALDLLVVDRDAQFLVAAGIARREPEQPVGRGQVEARAPRPVGDTDDDGATAAVHEEIVHRAGQGPVGEIAAEVTPVFGKARDADRLVDGPAFGPAEKTGRRQ
jgi:hypothetical protein